MRRTDRLFELIQILRDGRLHRASDMADQLEVSVRTIWRDMATLIGSGLPVEGERGVGYILRSPITLPPMILSPDEMEALHLGARLVADGADPGLARAARTLASKIAAASPSPTIPRTDELFVFTGTETLRAVQHLSLIRVAIRDRRRLILHYEDGEGYSSDRIIRPLQMEFWGRVWTLAAFCETRSDFRSFRVDRMINLTTAAGRFTDEPGRTLADYRAKLDVPLRSLLANGHGAH
jgi:predicted DNA-binding transcriptional regulator YafY